MRFLIRACQWDENHPDLLYYRYKLAEASGDTNEAISLLERAIDEEHDEPDSLNALLLLPRKIARTQDEKLEAVGGEQ